MNNLQLADVLVAPTGVGLLYTAYEQGSDVAVWKNGSGAGRSTVSLKRTQAKPTLAFPGVERMELKRTKYHTVGTEEFVSVVTIATSIPVPIVSADRQDLYKQIMLTSINGFLITAMDTGAIPT